MNKSKMDKKYRSVIISMLLLLSYTIIIGSVFGTSKIYLFGSVSTPLLLGLLVIFGLELLNTILFQLRIWLTSKDKIQYAAIVGAISWMVYLFQVMTLINGEITNFDNELVTLFIKAPPIGIATYLGIYLNSFIKEV